MTKTTTRSGSVLGAALIVLATAASAGAFQCPSLIEQGRAALENFKRTAPGGPIKDAKVVAVESKLRYAQDAHTAEQHETAVKEANEALKMLGR